MATSAKDVMALRKRTGVGMMDCKKALEEAGSDMDRAVEILREKLKGKMDERADREASEGAVAIAKSPAAVAMIKLLSETDFTARNEGFVSGAQQIADLVLAGPDGEIAATDPMTKIVDDLRITTKENISLGRAVKRSAGEPQGVVGSYLHHNRKIGALVVGQGPFTDELLKGLCQHVAAAVPPLTPEPMAVDEAGLPQDTLDRQKTEFVEEARESGKPDKIIEKMIAGKMSKWVDEHTLLGQTYIRDLDAKKPVNHYLPEGATIRQFVRFALGT